MGTRTSTRTMEMIPTQLRALMQPLWDKPDDFVLWGIVADWCEENGLDDWNDCIRWLIKERRVACDYPKHARGIRSTKYARSWYEEEYFRRASPDRHDRNVTDAYIPNKLFKKMRCNEYTGQGRFYLTTIGAYLALLDAWEKQ